MMRKNLLFLSVLNLLSLPVLANDFHSHEGDHSGPWQESHNQPHLSAQLLPTLSGQSSSGTVRFTTHTNHQHSTTSLDASVSLPLGVSGFNTDSLTAIEALTVTLTNPDASLNCALPLKGIGFTPVAGGAGYTAIAGFELHEIRQLGQTPVYLAGNCTLLPDAFNSSSPLIVSIFSGKTLLVTLTGNLQ